LVLKTPDSESFSITLPDNQNSIHVNFQAWRLFAIKRRENVRLYIELAYKDKYAQSRGGFQRIFDFKQLEDEESIGIYNIDFLEMKENENTFIEQLRNTWDTIPIYEKANEISKLNPNFTIEQCAESLGIDEDTMELSNSCDNIENKIILWTLYIMLRGRELEEGTSKIIKKAYLALKNSTSLQQISFDKCIGRSYNSLNSDYKLLHAFCRFILEFSGPNGSH